MLYYVRHGETVWNRQQRLQGRLDSPLTLWGVRLAVAYGEWLHETLTGESDIAICSSPMGRALQTATIVADSIGVAAEHVTTDELLAEHDIGAWGGRTWAEIEREHGDTNARLKDWDHRPPGGETRREMLARAESWLARPRPERVTVVVSHGGFSRAFRCSYLGLGVERAQEIPTHAHGRLYELNGGLVNERVAVDELPPPEMLLG